MVEIWQINNGDEWTDEAFDAIEQLLMERLGYLPPQEDWEEADRRLEDVQKFLDADELEKALQQTDFALDTAAHYGKAHYARGMVLDQMGQTEEAIRSISRALELDPGLRDARKELGYIYKEVEIAEKKGKEKKVTFFDSYGNAWKKYGDFTGRARRQEYWGFTLITTTLFFALFLIIFSQINLHRYWSYWSGIFTSVFYLVILIPSVSVTIRRLHDTGRGSVWIFINLVPLIGSLILFLILLHDSQAGTNQYGPNPKQKA